MIRVYRSTRMFTDDGETVGAVHEYETAVAYEMSIREWFRDENCHLVVAEHEPMFVIQHVCWDSSDEDAVAVILKSELSDLEITCLRGILHDWS